MDRDEEKHYDIAQIGLWYGCNYGAILTTYALYKYMDGLGKKVLLLNQAPLVGEGIAMDPENIAHQFMKRHAVDYSPMLYGDDDMDALNNLADVFVVGSDQVWRWEYSKRHGFFYFLDFVRGEKRKIAVAASFGIDREERPPSHLQKARYYMQRFDAISVREQSGLGILERDYHVSGEWLLDPVFMQSADTWRKLATTPAMEQPPYLLAYVLDPDEKIQTLVEQVSARLSLPVVWVGNGQHVKNSPMEPEKWLGLICHSAYFITDSYHGVCFAHIFNIPFVCVAPQRRGLARFDSLLGFTGLKARLVTKMEAGERLRIALEPVDWTQANAAVTEGRSKATAWLNQALHAPRSKYCEWMGNMTYEMLYAHNGEKDRDWEAAAAIGGMERRLTRTALPILLKIKAGLLHLLYLGSFGKTSATFLSKRQRLKRIRQQLEIHNNNT